MNVPRGRPELAVDGHAEGRDRRPDRQTEPGAAGPGEADQRGAPPEVCENSCAAEGTGRAEAEPVCAGHDETLEDRRRVEQEDDPGEDGKNTRDNRI